MSHQEFYHLSIDETFKILNARKEGLSQEEANQRLAQHGLNKLPEEEKTSWLFLLLVQFNNTLVYILLGAAIISFFLNDLIDMSVILAAVFINVLVGFIQEYKANQAMAKLKKVITLMARVLRDGREQEIEAEKLVPGDIIFLQAGDKIPADGRLVSVKDLEVNEASLTGESVPVKKEITELNGEVTLAERKNMAFLGTIVAEGKGEMVVTETGGKTELGKVAVLIKETPEEKSPFQKKLNHFSHLLGYLAIGISVVIFVMGVLIGLPFIQVFTTSVAIAVSVIPEGLVLVITAILAIGMQRILKQKALVKKLVAAETLGSTNVICTDKTGTLTQGKMRLSHLVTLNHDWSSLANKSDKEKIKEEVELTTLLKIGLLCNNAVMENPEDEFSAWKMLGNPTEQALLLVGAELGFYRQELEKEQPRLDEVPFDSNRKYMMTLHRYKKKGIVYLKGAPEKVLAMSQRIHNGLSVNKMDDSLKKEFEKKFEEMSGKGLRILAIAYQPVEKEFTTFNHPASFEKILNDFIFVGLVGIKDSLRPEAKETVALCKKAGINIVMITGDHKLTAKAIAQELGLKSEPVNIIEGKELAKIKPEELTRRVKEITVYARVTPKDKLQIVNAWQKQGAVVAMTGDGINDAPALKTADIGVALGSGSDVAKETSDLVILDDNFKTIVAAVEQGRIIFDNIKKIILYLLSDSFTEIILITGAILIDAFTTKDFSLPLLASQILWVNLVNDSFPSIALTMEPGEKEVMAESPIGRKRLIFTKEMKVLTFLISFFSGFGNLLLYWFLTTHGFEVAEARTIVFANVGIDSLLYVFSIQSLRHPIFSKRIMGNRYLLSAVILGLILQIAAIYFAPFQKFLYTVSLPAIDWLIIAVTCFMVITLVELTKYLFLLKKKNETSESFYPVRS